MTKVVQPNNEDLKMIHLTNMMALQKPSRARALACGVRDGAVKQATTRIERASGCVPKRVFVIVSR